MWQVDILLYFNITHISTYKMGGIHGLNTGPDDQLYKLHLKYIKGLQTEMNLNDTNETDNS